MTEFDSPAVIAWWQYQTLRANQAPAVEIDKALSDYLRLVEEEMIAKQKKL